MATESLSEKQSEALQLIVDFIDDNGYSPTLREITAQMEHSSVHWTAQILDALEKKGAIQRVPGQARTIRPV